MIWLAAPVTNGCASTLLSFCIDVASSLHLLSNLQENFPHSECVAVTYRLVTLLSRFFFSVLSSLFVFVVNVVVFCFYGLFGGEGGDAWCPFFFFVFFLFFVSVFCLESRRVFGLFRAFFFYLFFFCGRFGIF